MAKKAKATKGRKAPKAKPKRKQSRTTVSSAADSSISVTDGAMKDIFRSAFLKRD